jgi:hypothetical protein
LLLYKEESRTLEEKLDIKVAGLTTSLKIPFRVSYRRSGFKVSGSEFQLCFVSEKKLLIHECKHFMDVHGMHA